MQRHQLVFHLLERHQHGLAIIRHRLVVPGPRRATAAGRSPPLNTVSLAKRPATKPRWPRLNNVLSLLAVKPNDGVSVIVG